MYKLRVLLIFFILQYGFSNALPESKSYRMNKNVVTPNVDELNSRQEIQEVADNSENEIRAFRPVNINIDSSNALKDEQINTPQEASSDSPSTKHHRWHFGCHSDNTEKNTRSLDSYDNHEDNIVLEVRQGPQGQTQQPGPMQQQQQVPTLPQTTMPMQNQQLPQMQNPQMLTQPPPGNMQPMVGGSGQMHPQDGQFHSQFQPPQIPNTSTMGQTPTGYPTQPPAGYPTQPPAGYPTQPPAGYPMQPPSGYPTQPSSGYPTQPSSGYPTQPSSGYPMQPPAGYPAQPPYNSQPMGWPTNTGNNPFPVNTAPPYNGYPPTGQMQLPIPQNQFTGYGPSLPYTNPVYNTPLSPSQNDLESQIASAFLATQLSNMMRDPTTREAMLYFVTELRSFLSNPNAIPFMKALNHRAQDIMNSPATYNQYMPQNLPHSTSTIVQVQDGANHLLDKVKSKGGKIMSFVKEMVDANGRMLEGTMNDIPVLNSVAKIGTGLTNAGVGIIDGLLSPWLQPSGHGGTTITTVSTPQTTYPYPNTQYQTPTSISVGK